MGSPTYCTEHTPPTMIEGIARVLTGKLSRAPTVNGIAHVLHGADHDGEDAQKDGGVEVTDAVGPVIVPGAL